MSNVLGFRLKSWSTSSRCAGGASDHPVSASRRSHPSLKKGGELFETFPLHENFLGRREFRLIIPLRVHSFQEEKDFKFLFRFAEKCF
jgi:hypothetical protein